MADSKHTKLREDVYRQIKELICKARDDALVPNIKKILKLLEKEHIAYKIRIKPEHVGVHAKNRDGYGINVVDIHELIVDIFHVGWDWDEVRAVCSDKDPMDEESILINKKLGEEHPTLWPQIPLASLHYFSLGASHTNGVLIIAGAGMPNQEDSITVDGKICVRKISLKDADYAEAINEGLTWLVIPHEVLNMFPDLAQLIQSALNARVGKSDTELQVLRKIHNSWIALKNQLRDSKHLVDFDKVKRAVLRSKPPCASSVPEMYKFILKFGGGQDPKFLRETEAYIKKNSVSTRTVGSDVYDELGKTDCKINGNVKSIVRFAHGILKFLYTCNSKVIGNECRALTTRHITKIANKRTVGNVAAAEDLMGEIRTHLSRVQGLSDDVVRDHLHIFDMNLVVHVLGVVAKDVAQFESMEAIAHKCVKDIKESAKFEFATKWDMQPNIPEKKPAAEKKIVLAPRLDMRDYDEDGKLKDKSQIMSELGFEVGMQIFRHSDSTYATINAILRNGVVKLELLDQSEVTVACSSFVKNEWCLKTRSSGPEIIQSSGVQSTPFTAWELRAKVVQGKIYTMLYNLAERYDHMVKKVNVQSKPKKQVLANENFKKTTDLVLAPFTLKVEYHIEDTNKNKTVPSNAVNLGVLMKTNDDKKVRFFLLPHVDLRPEYIESDDGFLAPFWHLSSIDEQDQANAKITSLGDYDESDDFPPSIVIPMMELTCTVKKGDPIVVFKEKVEAQSEPCEPLKKVRKLKGKM